MDFRVAGAVTIALEMIGPMPGTRLSLIRIGLVGCAQQTCARTIGFLAPRRKTKRKCEQGEAAGEHQRPQFKCCFARRSEAAPGGEPNDRRPCMIRSTVRRGHFVRIVPKQNLAQIHHEAS
jgi:hypothetical protein